MGYSIDPISADCYEGTTCLINKFGIKDEKKLSQMETLITTAKCQELEISPIVGDFGFDHYKAIHKYIFEDLYDWAGKVRTASISKKGTVFTLPESIEPLADRIFTGLQKNNMLHPFREGNGRTQRVFLTQLIRHSGHDINFSTIDTDELMIATIQSANGIVDYLRNLFKESIS